MTYFPFTVIYRRPVHAILLFGALSAVTSALAALLGSHLVWNTTPSLPRGLYWLTRDTCALDVGDIAVFPVPPALRPLVAERHYLPTGHVLLKPVAALAGDTVCIRDDVAFVNDRPFGPVLRADLEGRELPVDPHCGPVPPRHVYVASHHPRSFDSRTFGPVPVAAVEGKATPVWTF
jgi:conjugative transfer signal peptidase TraF